MSFAQLNIHHLRNITEARLSLNSRFNFIYGANGSGKTSLLEAIYLLSSGHSFRTRENTPLINYNAPSLMIYARTESNESISLQKTKSGSTQVKINQAVCQRSSDLAYRLPCQVFYQDIFQIIDAGPTIRRALLDWGLFHVKQSYHTLWKDYRRALKQRNMLLRKKASLTEFTPWNRLLSDLAEQMHQLRLAYFEEWNKHFQRILPLLTDVSCSLQYEKGWDKKNQHKLLMDILAEQFESDLQRQYTNAGPHQADIQICASTIKAKHGLSRGQQKIILIALKLAQAQLLAKPCIYLFDDLMAELDTEHLQQLFNVFNKINGQMFFTSLNPNQIQTFFNHNSDIAIFSTEGGNIQSHI